MFSEIVQKIEEYHRIIIHTHRRPDGDCIGSAIGLKEIIETSFTNKSVSIVGQESEYISFLGKPDIVDDEEFIGALSICVDTASSNRVSDQRFLMSDFVIKIDHHISIDDYGDINYVDTSRPATAQIIVDFLLECQLAISKVGKRALFTGILTDTGRFKYRGVNSDTFKALAVLFSAVDNEYMLDIYSYLDVESIDFIKFKGYVLSSFTILDDTISYMFISKQIIEEYGVSLEEAASVVNELGKVRGIEMWVLFIEYPDGIRGRVRSKNIPVDLLCNQFNGGGHRLASGITVKNTEQIDSFIREMKKLVK